MQSEQPPPRDPTLLRLTGEIAEAVHEVVGKRVRVVSRALRDESCTSLDGVCSRELALHSNADRAVSLYLEAGFRSLTVRIYAAGVGLEKTGALPCRWDAGLVSCDTAPLGGLLAITAPKKDPKRAQRIKRRFKKLTKRLNRCRRLGWGDLPPPDRPDAVEVKFGVGANGRITDLRLLPAGLQDVPAYACMARVVERLKLPSGPRTPDQRFPLPSL